jgi:preprotein translocase subunit SecA
VQIEPNPELDGADGVQEEVTVQATPQPAVAPVASPSPFPQQVTPAPEPVEPPRPERRQPAVNAKGLEAAQSRNTGLSYSAPSLDSEGGAPVSRSGGQGATANTTTVTGHEPARNAPCPCGSGKKYKKCHGAPGAPPL